MEWCSVPRLSKSGTNERVSEGEAAWTIESAPPHTAMHNRHPLNIRLAGAAKSVMGSKMNGCGWTGDKTIARSVTLR